MRIIRKSTIKDIHSIHRLLHEYGKKGDLLSRPLSQLYDHLRDFWVCEDDEADGRIIGCCALQFCWEDLAEIRSLAVSPDYFGEKIGSQLVETCLSEAVEYKIMQVFTLTYRPGFFKKLGFQLIDRNDLPIKIWSDCITCVNFPNCNENAMMKKLHSYST